MTEKETELVHVLRVIIKTIKSKVSKKILNRLQIAKMQNIIKQIQRGFKDKNFSCLNYMYWLNREPVIKRDHFVFLAETHHLAICHSKYLS